MRELTNGYKNIYVYKIAFDDCSLLKLDNVNILVDYGGNINGLEKTVFSE